MPVQASTLPICSALWPRAWRRYCGRSINGAEQREADHHVGEDAGAKIDRSARGRRRPIPAEAGRCHERRRPRFRE
jgi:hypothetical protein